MEVESEILSDVIECKSLHERAYEYGARAWKAKGRNIDIVYWDTGNSWCAIMDIIPKNKIRREEVTGFYKRLKTKLLNHYHGEW